MFNLVSVLFFWLGWPCAGGMRLEPGKSDATARGGRIDTGPDQQNQTEPQIFSFISVCLQLVQYSVDQLKETEY